MAIPFLTRVGLGIRAAGQRISAAARAAAEGVVQDVRKAWSGIRGGVARGQGASKIGETLRGIGLPIPRPVIETAVTRERRRREQGRQLRFLGRQRKPDPRKLPLALTAIQRQYAFLVTVDGIDSHSGDKIQKYITISTDELLSRDEIEALAEEAFERDTERYAILAPQFRLVEGMKRND